MLTDNTFKPPLIIVAALLSALISACGDSRPKSPEGMVYIPGGEYTRGLEHPMMPEAAPLHKVRISPFFTDATEVTNSDFAKFVDATGYKTVAERPINPEDYPGVDPALLVPGSLVIVSPAHPVNLSNYSQWWRYVPGASWKHPEGPESNLEGRENHPVVHIAWEDATAYAEWTGKRLPTEAEWEYAARGGLSQAEFAWGNDARPDGKIMANTFQGNFPHNNTGEDGHAFTAPVGSYKPNNYGLYDVSGNVWEWVSDWYSPGYYSQFRSTPIADNPAGPKNLNGALREKVQKGGSFMCTDDYCARFRPGARGHGDPLTSSNHVGFRLVQDLN